MGRSKLIIHLLVKYLDSQNVLGLGTPYSTNIYKKQTGRVRTDFITLTGRELFFTLEPIQ